MLRISRYHGHIDEKTEVKVMENPNRVKRLNCGQERLRGALGGERDTNSARDA